MQIKHLFALAAPLVFLFLAACEVGDLTITINIPCEGPIPVLSDTLGGNFNGLCPYYIWDGDTLKLIIPGVIDLDLASGASNNIL